MRPRNRTLLAAAATLVLAAGCDANDQERGLSVPIEYHKLDNGLKVVLSRDMTAPTVVVESVLPFDPKSMSTSNTR